MPSKTDELRAKPSISSSVRRRALGRGLFGMVLDPLKSLGGPGLKHMPQGFEGLTRWSAAFNHKLIN